MRNVEPVPTHVRRLHPDDRPQYAFSICTLMTRPDQYAQMLTSYRAAGFSEDCEFLCIDNSQGNIYDAFSGYNAFLVEAQGEYVILTHQDVELSFDDRAVLEERLQQLIQLERFSRDLNRTEFTGARFSDSEWLPGAEAGRHGSDVVT